MRRSTASALFIIGFAFLAWWALPTRPLSVTNASKPQIVRPATVPAGSSATKSPSVPAPAVATPPAPDPDRSHLLDDLNQPAGTIQSDLRLLQELFAAWRTNFPRDGNPVGENAEITRSLTGANALNLALVPKEHAAINRAGELTDRWGTPFRFHQLSGTRMEIRSAGPDRRFGTDDDAVLTPQ